jgi:hypothetical protein
MKRRQLVLTTGLAAAIVPMRLARGQLPPKKRAAVVIGVDKAGDLPMLRAAASGARQVEALLKAEGYDVTALVDDVTPVTVDRIFAAIDSYVRNGTVEQLIVYFAGHGLAAEYVEYWLLSDATRNPNQSVSLRESVQLARVYSGIPNVVFISDACRSTPRSLGLSAIRGGIIFPTSGSVQPSDVDQFLATLVGDPAWEVAMQDSTSNYAGIYTTTLISAFAEAPTDIVSKVAGLDVVPNKRLKRFLEREVPLRAQRINIQLNQRPDAQVTSDDDIYIAKAAKITQAASIGTATGLRHVAAANLNDVGLRGIVQVGPRKDSEIAAYRKATRDLDDKTGFSTAQFEVASQMREVEAFARQMPSSFETGFLVSGQPVRVAFLILDGLPRPFERLYDQAVAAKLPPRRAASALIQFEDGSSTVVAALHGFVGNIVVARNGVINVSYVPRHGGYDSKRLNDLHSSVATAARFGVFRIEREESGPKNTGARLADTVRMMKAVDPTLGLYAAYAYSEAGEQRGVASVRSIMRSDLGFDLFDTAMLSGALEKKEAALRTCAPFCPMLAQGWALLRVNNVVLPKEIEACRDHLLPSLWTTLSPKGTELLLSALRSRRLLI